MSETVAAAPSAHELLLALAGWVDDDLLATGRELVAVGEETPALELLVASLAAGRTALPSPVRDALVDAAVALRVEPHADRGLPPGVAPGETAHRFAAEAGPADVAVRVAGIGTNLPLVARSGARLSLVWRLTPAGAAPGPLPHPVLLAAVQSGGPVEVLAYQLGAALARAGVPASVEAFVDGTTLPPYHRAALSEALPLDPTADDTAALPPPAPQAHPVPQPPPVAQARAGRAAPDEPQSTAGPADPADPAGSEPASTEPKGAGPNDSRPNGSGPEAAGRRDLSDIDAAGHATDDGSGPDVSTPSRGVTRQAGPGPSGSPSGPAPGAGPFDDGPSHGPDLDTPAHPYPVAAPPADDGTRADTDPAQADDVPRPGAGTDRPVDGHPAPRPAPRRIAPGPESPEWFGDPPPGPIAGRDTGPGPGANGVPTPANGSLPTGGPRPVPSTGPIALPRPDDALNGPLDRPLLDSQLDRADGTSPEIAGPETVGPETAGPETGGGAAAGPAADTAFPGGDAWDQDWATGAWSTAAADAEPVTGPTPSAGAPGPPPDEPQRTHPRLRSVSGPPPILRAPAPPGSRPAAPGFSGIAPSASGPQPNLRAPAPPGLVTPGPGGYGPGPLRPAPAPRGDDSGPSGLDQGPETGSDERSGTPEAGSPRPRHRLDVPGSPGTAETTDAPADAPDLADLADVRTDEQPTVGSEHDRPHDEAGSGPPADPAEDEHRVPDPGAPTGAPTGTPTGTPTGDRDTDARAQHPAAQDPTGRPPQAPSGNGHRPAPRPSGGARAPAPGPDLGGRLTPNEQDLLRRLQDELAARDNGAPDHGPHNGSAHPDSG